MTKPHLEKTNNRGEWEKGKYYKKGDTFTYRKEFLFFVTENHLADDDTEPFSNTTDKGRFYPFRRIYEADSPTSFKKKKGNTTATI